ncbi:Protein kinase-like domain protein [Akanthomyces lecanii RCEF 1005]|uniref:Protein kinase-like domain protein n=1 Tax=Akanthomyces lecanii RCEF 1005 TaxID=1081108 RepID=A0A162N3N3_CORDF|nr:Protein kinase-like domain protein [Akanthomyces lecanii RCEF 1005]
MKDIVPCNQSQQTLLQAMELIYESKHRYLYKGSNIPAHIRTRFLKYCNLTRDQDVFAGWVNETDDVPEYDADAIQQIEDDVIAETMARWAVEEQAEKEKARKEQPEQEQAEQKQLEKEKIELEQVEREAT